MYLILVSMLLVGNAAGKFSSSHPCFGRGCTWKSKSMRVVGRRRVLANKVSKDFSGYARMEVSNASTVFTAEFQINRGIAWPRLAEGKALPNNKSTPGYPVALRAYMKDINASISYAGRWSGRENGPSITPWPVGTLYNGAQIYLNAPTNYRKGTKIARWPFTAEIYIWNRYDNFKPKEKTTSCGRAYKDTDGTYVVRMAVKKRGIVKVPTWYILNKSNRLTSDMNINTAKLFRHLTKYCKLNKALDLIQVTVIAMGIGRGTDGRFTCRIRSMGRVDDGKSAEPVKPRGPLATSAASSTSKSTSAPEPSSTTAPKSESEKPSTSREKSTPEVSAEAEPAPAKTTKEPTEKSGTGKNEAQKVQSGGDGGGVNWELIGAIIGAVATIIGAVLGVYLAQGKCLGKRRKKDNYRNDDDFWNCSENFSVRESVVHYPGY